MVVGEIPDSVDFLVVGGGPGGYVSALVAAQLGRKVVVVDALGEAGCGQRQSDRWRRTFQRRPPHHCRERDV